MCLAEPTVFPNGAAIYIQIYRHIPAKAFFLKKNKNIFLMKYVFDFFDPVTLANISRRVAAVC